MKYFKQLMGACALMAAISAHSATYAPNFVWQRWADWTPGAIPGASNGNPDDDQAGTPVWRYGYLTGGVFNSVDPWFDNSMQPAVWDDVWWGSNVGGVWARNYFGPNVDNDNANPPISRWSLYHDVSERTHSSDYTSAWDWVNPVGHGAILNISGTLKFTWEGHFANSSPLAPIEGIVAKFDSSSGTFSTLWSGTVLNPTAGAALSSASAVTVPMTFVGVRFDEGDFLRVTFRADTPESSTPLWLGMADSLYMRLVSVVPEPTVFELICVGLAMVFAVRRLRRG